MRIDEFVYCWCLSNKCASSHVIPVYLCAIHYSCFFAQDDDIIKDDVVDEEGSDAVATQSGSDTETKGEEENSSVRKRKARKAD